jgi:uncharacterized protein
MLCARILSIALLLTYSGAAQDAARHVHVVRASGEATVTAKPDRAEVTIGIATQGPTAEAAAAQNAAQSTQALEAIKHVLGRGGEVRSSGYSIFPVYQNVRNGTPQKVIGYTAKNSVLVIIDDLPLAGKVVDASTRAGANEIGNISFSLRDDQAVRSQALAQAATKARASAEAIAKALSLHVVGVLEAETSDATAPSLQPRMMFQAAQSVEVGTSIESGNIDISATVIVTLEVQ